MLPFLCIIIKTDFIHLAGALPEVHIILHMSVPGLLLLFRCLIALSNSSLKMLLSLSHSLLCGDIFSARPLALSEFQDPSVLYLDVVYIGIVFFLELLNQLGCRKLL